MVEQVALVDRYEHTLLITLNRPEARNAINAKLAAAIGDTLEEADDDPDIWVVVLTGAGDKAFCAGADLKAIAAGESTVPVGREHFGFAGYTEHFISKPTIAAVNGYAMGGGTELVLASDLAVAAESASFGLPEVSRGIIAAAGGAFRLPRQIPRKVGMHMLLTGQPLQAREALAYGLLNQVVADGSLLDAAMSLASTICSNAPLAVQASKRVAYGATAGTWRDELESWSLTKVENERVRDSQDAVEGPRAFAEKRPPRWTGR